jgi:hypothetical protein
MLWNKLPRKMACRISSFLEHQENIPSLFLYLFPELFFCSPERPGGNLRWLKLGISCDTV